MKRRIAGAAIALTGLIVLGGCGADKETSAPEIEFPGNHVEETAEAPAESAQPESAAPSETETEQEEQMPEEITGSAPAVSITRAQKEWYTEDGEILLFTAEASAVTLESGGSDALAAALSERWPGIEGADYEMAIRDAKDDYADREDKTGFYPYSTGTDIWLTRSDSTVISFGEYDSDYMGGAHGFYGHSGTTFDVESGRELALADLLSDAEGFYARAVDYIAKELEEDYGDELFPEYRETVGETFDGDWPPKWYLNAAGIVLIYNPYEVGPYAMGVAEVLLPYNTFAEFIDAKYIAPHSELMAQAPANEELACLLGEDSVRLDVSSNEYSLNEVTVLSGLSSDEIDTFAYHRDSYVIKREGRSFLITVEDYASDDNVILVYEVTGGSVRWCDELGGGEVSMLMGTDRLSVRMTLNVFGTYGGRMIYALDSEGMLSQTSEVFEIDSEYEMTVMRELPVTMDGAERTLAVGERLTITGTDNAGTAYFRLAGSGETGEIRYTRDEESRTLFIDGVSEFEYFDALPYAG
ncbi:MAG: RsiV family protein [Roseburia sp.]|nr:RsiV family protein [Roseburia sp.]